MGAPCNIDLYLFACEWVLYAATDINTILALLPLLVSETGHRGHVFIHNDLMLRWREV